MKDVLYLLGLQIQEDLYEHTSEGRAWNSFDVRASIERSGLGTVVSLDDLREMMQLHIDQQNNLDEDEWYGTNAQRAARELSHFLDAQFGIALDGEESLNTKRRKALSKLTEEERLLLGLTKE